MFDFSKEKSEQLKKISDILISPTFNVLFGLLCGILISLTVFSCIVCPSIERKLEREITAKVEEQMCMDVDETYEFYSDAFARLDPNSEWYAFDKHYLEVDLFVWIQKNELSMNDEQKIKFYNLYYESIDDE